MWVSYIGEISAKKYRGVMFHDTEKWSEIWRKIGLWSGKWHEEFGKFLPVHSKVSKLELWWVRFIQNRKFMRLKFTDEICFMTMKNDAKLGQKLTCCFEIDTTV